MTAISIALATYNGERFLIEQLRSLAQQTCLPAEPVVVDDGSSDRTRKILTEFASNAPFPVRLFENEERLGWRGNFMKAATLCEHPLIAFCDQDDIWYGDKLEQMSGMFDDPETLLAYHDADLIDSNGAVFGSLRAHEKDSLVLAPRARPTIWSNPLGLTMTFRRSLLQFAPYWRASADPRDNKMPAAHDQWFYYLASNLGQIRYNPKRLLGYRQHGHNAVGYQAKKRRPLGVVGLNPLQDAYIKMLERFCAALEQAETEQGTDFSLKLPAAIRPNKSLLRRLRLRRLVHSDPSFLKRAIHLRALVEERAFSRKTEWNLGYKAFLQGLLIGLPAGR